MSIQAVAWVLAQPTEDLPVIPRAIMFALANHADEETGHCWPSIAKIAKEAGVSERTVSRYLAALARNGYIDKEQKNKGHFGSNNYWILFDRRSGSRWQFFEPKDEGTEEPHATEADGSEADGSETRTPLVADGRTPLVADAIEAEPSDSEPSESEIVSLGAQLPESPPATGQQGNSAIRQFGNQASRPHGFAPANRQREQQRLKAAEEARKPKLRPVIEGSEPWFAWLKYKNPDKGGRCHPPTLTCTIEVNGRADRGWYFPTLWPPKETGPPTPLDAKKAG